MRKSIKIFQDNNNVFLWFALYTLTIFIYKDFGIPTILGYALLALLLLISALRKKLIILSGFLTVDFGVLVAFQSVAIFLSFVFTGNTNYIMYVPALMLCFACVILAKPNMREIERTIRIWSFLSVALAIYVILVAVNSGLFYRFVYPFLSADGKEATDFQLKWGYGICIGGNSVLIDYIIVFTVLMYINNILIRSREEAKKSYIFKDVALILLLLGAIVLENRKSELLSVLAVIVIMIVSGINYRSIRRRRKIILLSLFLAVFVLPLIVVVMYKAGLLGRYEIFIQRIIGNITTDTNVDISTGRLRLWGIAADIFTEHPMFGIGWGNFSNYVPDIMQSGHQDIFELRNVHNCFLQLLCETGIVGFFIYIIPLFHIFFRALKTVRRLKTMPYCKEQTVIASTCVGYQMFFLIVGFIDPCWYKLIFLCLYSLTIIMINYLEKWESLYEIQKDIS